MKKLTLPLLASLFVFGTASAQDYNKWSIDLNGGFAKPARTLSPGFAGETFKNMHLDGGVRYSINNKFGVKASFGYDRLNEWTNKADIETNHYRTSLEGVVNLGRVLNFESWTSVLNAQVHAGGGYSWMNGDKFSGTDNMGHLMAGLTGQIKVHRRIALNADFTVIQSLQQNNNWDGVTATNRSVFQGTMFNATVGVSVYLGKHAQHADWYAEAAKENEVIAELTNRLTKIENDLKDTDNDGVPDYLDLEPNTPANTLVDSKGRSIDSNNNGIADNIEKFIDEKYGDLNKGVSADDAAMIKELVNKGYVAAYFDFDKAQPTTVDGINFIVNYLRNNPSASVEVIGYADAVGNKDYNNKLSERRANAVKDIIVKSGVSASKVSAKGNGIDDAVSKDSAAARKIARKVVFKIN
ncbi:MULTISPECIES: OmpA family protein [Myroides]|uniref:OmpA family protein n=1 Tax=Myroides albus TaxID=2562892 RepID=A0A6I3LIM5_9FLAO|nr:MULTISPECIES: OmpA family protein [Myroides]MTG98428.1 OmpA family protein [Myroides albus]MVX36100.1 OmpA family protein [Myroides sp. LoEW2-1]UVD79659.1 OmpA family protein [Myroides albus]